MLIETSTLPPSQTGNQSNLTDKPHTAHQTERIHASCLSQGELEPHGSSPSEDE